jgi:hypothetical protein
VQLCSSEELLATFGARLVFVGSGSPEMAADFVASFSISSPVLVDETCEAFQAAGMRRSMFATLHWRTVLNAVRAWRRGFRQGRVAGSPWQQGGVVVFDRSGEICHLEVDRAGGDEFDTVALMESVERSAS